MLRLESSSTTAELPEVREAHPPARGAKPRRPERTQELLDRYAKTGTSECFEEIVCRYGAMVLAVCQAVTHDRHDAEDATQVTFFVLAERLRAGENIRSLGSWLQQVARRAAVDIRRSHARRQRRERNRAAPEAAPDSVASQCEGDQLAALVREELDRIPAKYRVPLVLHYFGGLDFTEAAAQLGLKPATLGVRLFRGRKLLGERLARRGIALSIPALTALLARVIRGSLSHALRQSAVRSACTAGPKALAAAPGVGSGMLSAIASSKVKLLVAAALLAAASAGARAAVHHLPQNLLDLGRFRLRTPSIRSSLPAIRADAGGSATQVAKGQKPPKDTDAQPEAIAIDLSRPVVAAEPGPSAAPSSAGGAAGGGVKSYASASSISGNSPVPHATQAGGVGATPRLGTPASPGASVPSNAGHAQPNSAVAMASGSTAGLTPTKAPLAAVTPPAGPLALFASTNNTASGQSLQTASIAPTPTAGAYPAGITPPNGGTFVATAPTPSGSALASGTSTVAGQVPGNAAGIAPPGGAPSSGTLPVLSGAAPISQPYAGLLQITSTGHSVPQLSFLASADPSVPTLPSGQDFLGVWSIPAGQIADVPLTLSYDHQLLGDLGRDPSQVNLWAYNGKWSLVTPAAPGGNLTIDNPTNIQFFGVATPEPGAGAVGAVVGLLLLMRRRPRGKFSS